MTSSSPIRLVPCRALAYAGSRLNFVDSNSIAFSFGTLLRIIHLLPDHRNANEEFIWEENEWTGISAVASNWRTEKIALCPTGRINPLIHIYSYPDKVLRCSFNGHPGSLINHIEFNRDGNRVVALSDRIDCFLVVWELTAVLESRSALQGIKVVETKLPERMYSCSFNPSNSDMVVTCGLSGIYIWLITDLASHSIITCTATYSNSKIEQIIPSQEHINTLPTLRLFEKSSTLTHIRHNKVEYTCYCWGLENSLWAANLEGIIVCVDCTNGSLLHTVPALSKKVSCTIVQLIMTKKYLLVVYTNGVVRWLLLSKGGNEFLSTFLEVSLEDLLDSPFGSIVSAICSSMYDKIVIGTSLGTLFALQIDPSCHFPCRAESIAKIQTCYGEGPVALATLVPYAKENGEGCKGVIAIGGKNGIVQLYSNDRAKLCGHKTFESSSNLVVNSQSCSSIIPGICALASISGRPLLAVGLTDGQLHILYLLQSTPYDIKMVSVWGKKLYHGPITCLMFHPSQPLLEVASSSARSVHVVNLKPVDGDFTICLWASAPSPYLWNLPELPGVTSLMWHSSDLVFATEDCLLCCVKVDIGNRAEGGVSSSLRWIFQSSTPLHGLCPHPSLLDGPFFAVSASLRALQVLRIPPGNFQRKFLVPPYRTLDAIDTLEAHQKGATVVSRSPNGSYLATGGADGLVGLWRVFDQQVELVHSSLVHSGTILAIDFSPDSAQLYSVSIDGTVFGLNLEGVESSGDLCPLDMSHATLATTATESTKKIGISCWLDDEINLYDKSHSRKLELSAEVTRVRDELTALSCTLKNMILDNSKLPSEEQLPREDLIVDMDGSAQAKNEMLEAVEKLNKDLQNENTKRALLGTRIMNESCNRMEISVKSVWAFRKTGLCIQNYVLRRRSEMELAQIEHIKLIRAIELQDKRVNKTEREKDISWLSCVLNEDLLKPVIDTVRVENMSNLAPNYPGSFQQQTNTSLDFQGSSKKRENDSENNHLNIASVAQKRFPAKSSVIHLLYSPLSIRTARQKRSQILLLFELITEKKVAFNECFNNLAGAKDDYVEKIQEKSNRIVKILTSLHELSGVSNVNELHDTSLWNIFKCPYDVSKMEDDDLKVKQSEPMFRKVTQFTNDNKNIKTLQNLVDSGARGLNDMMNGTIECVKQDVPKLVQVDRPAWIDLPMPEFGLSVEQLKEAAEYEAKKSAYDEEESKLKKALELELKRLKVEVLDLIKMFDDKVEELAAFQLQVQQCVGAYEIMIVNLALGILKCEYDDVVMEKLSQQFLLATTENDVANFKLKAFKGYVEAGKNEIINLEAEDKLMERSFKKAIQEAAKNPIDIAEMYPQLVRLFKLREVDVDYQYGNASNNYERGSIFGMNSMRKSSQLKSQQHLSLHTSKAAGSNMALSRRQRSSRMSNGAGSKMAGQGSLGPMQEAMKEVMNSDKKYTYLPNDPFSVIDEEQEKQQMMLNSATQDLDYPGFEIEDQVWNRLIELRTAKIAKETEIKKCVKAQADKKNRLGFLQSQTKSTQLKLDEILMAKKNISENSLLRGRCLEVVAQLNQGQDEVSSYSITLHASAVLDDEGLSLSESSYSDSVLVPSSVIENRNESIYILHSEKVRVLNKIKEFQQSDAIRNWNMSILEAECHDLSEQFIDLQLLKVTKKLQFLLKEDHTVCMRNPIKRLEANIYDLSRFHKEKVRLESSRNYQFLQKMNSKKNENDALALELVELEQTVKAREDIILARMESNGGKHNLVQQAAERMHCVALRTHHVNLASSQEEEILNLRAELNKLRKRSYPSFAHVSKPI